MAEAPRPPPNLTTASSFPIFIDTNVGTHFATIVSSDDTVADLKGKIRTDHALCFPEFGEVSVQAMKVRRKGSFYHLSDSMPVKSSFMGVKGTWFLHLDLVSTTSIKKIQAEAARNILSESCPDKLYLTQTERNANMLPQNNEEGFVMYDFPDDKGQVPSESPTVLESRTLLDTLSRKLSTQGDSSLPNTGSCQPLILQSSDQLVSVDKDVGIGVHLNVQGDNVNGKSEMPPTELDKTSNPALLELEEPVNRSNAVVGSHFQQIEELIVDQVKTDDREEDHPIVGDNDVGASPIARKKEKPREKGSTVQTDQVLESQFQHPSAGRKNRKRKKDGSLEESSKDQVTGHNFDIGAHSKMVSNSGTFLLKTSPQEKHENNLASSEALPSDSLHLNPIEDGHKKKKRLSKLNDEFPRSRFADPSVTMTNADTGKQKQDAEGNDEEVLVTDNPDLGQQTDTADLISEGTEKVIDGSNVEVGMTKPSPATRTGSDNNKETLSKSTITRKNLPSQEVTNVNHEGPLDRNYVGLQRESSGTVIRKEAKHVRAYPELGSGLSADSRPINKKHKSVKHASSKSETLHSSVEHVNKENVEVPANNYNNLSREPDPVATDEDMESTNPSNRDSRVFTNIGAVSSHQDRRKKWDKTELPNPLSNTSETVDSSAGRATLENPNETSDSQLGHAGKESGDLILTSKPHEKKPKGSQKETGKADLPESVVPETVHSFVKEDGEENITQPSKDISNGTPCGDHGQQEKERKVEALSREVAANVTSATFDSTVHNSKGKKSKRCRKKSGKAELLEPLMSEATPLKDDAEDLKEPLGNIVDGGDIIDGTSCGDFGHPGKEAKGTTVSGEVAANVDTTIVVPTAPSHPNDKKLKHKRKKSVKSGLPNQESLKKANKVTEENQGVALDGTNKDLGQESKLAANPTEDTPLKHTAELDSVDTSNAKHKRLRHDKKKTTKGELVNPSPINNEPINSSENEHTHVNPEKVGTTNVISESVFNVGINPDGTSQHLEYPELSNKNTAELFDDSSENKTSLISAEHVGEKHTMGLSGKSLKESGKGTVHNMILQGSAELIEAIDHMELTKSAGDKINFIDYFTSKVSQPVPDKEITSRKRKPFLPPLDTTYDLLSPSVSDEQHKPSNTNLVNPSVCLASEELKSNETPKRKIVKKARKSDLRSCNAASMLLSPRKLLDGRAAKKHQESNSHRQVSASMGEKTNHVKAKNNSTNTGSKLQPPAGNESINAMVSTDEASLSKNADSFVKSRHVAASITQKPSSADANALTKENSTGEASELKGKQYKVAARKFPRRRYRKEANKSTQKEISLGTPANIFDDSTGGSSEDEFEINHRRTTLKAGLDNSSTSADSDGDLEETQTTFI